MPKTAVIPHNGLTTPSIRGASVTPNSLAKAMVRAAPSGLVAIIQLKKKVEKKLKAVK